MLTEAQGASETNATGGHGHEATMGSEALPLAPCQLPTAGEIAEAYHTGDGA